MERDEEKGESAAERARRRRAGRSAKARAVAASPNDDADQGGDAFRSEGVPPAVPRAVDLNPYAAPSHEEHVARSQIATGEPRLASRGSRFLARLVDQIFLLAVAFGVGVVQGMGGSVLSPLALANPMVMAAFLLPGLLVDWVLITLRGQSVGKILFRIKIVRDSGEPVGFVRGVLLREWIPFGLQMVPLIGMIISLVDAILIFGANRKCLHDNIAGTRVVEV